ncbi:hypothetical protein H0H92_001124, partial [Tricholoma furcatifolium]
MMKTYQSEIASLSRHDKGLHYMTTGITEEKLRSFDIDKISQIMSTNAPYMWELIDGLLAADAELQLKRDTWRRRKMQHQKGSKDANEHVDSEEKYWEFLDEGVPIIDEQDVAFCFPSKFNGVTTKIILSSPSASAINNAIQNDNVLPAPMAAHPTTSFPLRRASATLIWNQHGRLPK